MLSTCNRFEVYIAATDGHAAIRDVMSHLQEYSGLSQVELRQSLFMLSKEDAVWHLLKVSAGLDSLVVGEGQILSQVGGSVWVLGCACVATTAVIGWLRFPEYHYSVCSVISCFFRALFSLYPD